MILNLTAISGVLLGAKYILLWTIFVRLFSRTYLVYLGMLTYRSWPPKTVLEYFLRRPIIWHERGTVTRYDKSKYLIHLPRIMVSKISKTGSFIPCLENGGRAWKSIFHKFSKLFSRYPSRYKYSRTEFTQQRTGSPGRQSVTDPHIGQRTGFEGIPRKRPTWKLFKTSFILDGLWQSQ